MRQNLSKHDYFIKTSEKNAKGHFWSLRADYIKLLTESNFSDRKDARLMKMFSKEERVKKSVKSNFGLSEINGQFNSSVSNDSAYVSSTECSPHQIGFGQTMPFYTRYNLDEIQSNNSFFDSSIIF